MSLHSIIEPAGTLLTGWELVPHLDTVKGDVRNKDAAPKPDPEEGDRTRQAPAKADHDAASKWEQNSGRKLRKVR